MNEDTKPIDEAATEAVTAPEPTPTPAAEAPAPAPAEPEVVPVTPEPEPAPEPTPEPAPEPQAAVEEPASPFDPETEPWSPDGSAQFQRVKAEEFSSSSEWIRQVIGAHGYYVRDLKDGRRVLRPDSYVGSDIVEEKQ